VDHHLVALPRRPGIQLVVQGRLGQQPERIRLLLLQRRPVRLRRRLALTLVERLAGGGQGLEEQGADLRGQPAPDPHRAVLVRIDVEAPAGVLQRRLPGLGLAVHPPPASHDPRDVLGRAGAPHREQPVLGLGRGHARQLSDLGVGQLAAGEGVGQAGQGAECPRHAHVLASGAGGEPHSPGQPGRAGNEAVAPPAPGVEFADEIEEPGGGRRQMRGELGDLVTDTVQGRERLERTRLNHGLRANAVKLHDVALLKAGATLHRHFRGPWRAHCGAIATVIEVFAAKGTEAAPADFCALLNRHVGTLTTWGFRARVTLSTENYPIHAAGPSRLCGPPVCQEPCHP
jgi:hypothetical protein